MGTNYSEQLHCSKENKKRLMEAMSIHIKQNPQIRHRTVTYNEALGLVLDSYFDKFVFLKNGNKRK